MQRTDLRAGLDLLQELRELFPVVHDLDTVALLSEGLLHLLHLFFTILDFVNTHVANARDTSTHGGSGTTLAVLDCHRLFWLDTELLAGIEVDLWVRLAGRRIERGSGAVDVFIGEVLVDASLLERGNNARLGGGADNGHLVALLLQTLKLLGCTWAWFAFGLELGSDRTQFLSDIFLKLVCWHLEVVLLLETNHHATEVLPNEGFEQVIHSVTLLDVVHLKKFIGEICASLEGETLRQAEGVVTV